MDFLGVSALTWLFCAVLAAILYSGKGQSGIVGFLLGLILGPFGVLIALLIGPNQNELDRRQLKSGEVDMCPYCSELVRASAVVCKHCGRDLPAVRSREDALVTRARVYLQQHRDPYHQEWLRRDLLKDGYSEHEVDAAIQQATTMPSPSP